MTRQIKGKIVSVLIVSVMFLGAVEKARAAGPEFSMGGYIGGSSPEGFSVGARFGLGHSSGYTESFYDQTTGQHYKFKNVDRSDFDILFDMALGLPYMQAGALYVNYFMDEPVLLGIGIGAGYAVDTYSLALSGRDLNHGPYIRLAMPIFIPSLGVIVDYAFFQKPSFQLIFYYNMVANQW